MPRLRSLMSSVTRLTSWSGILESCSVKHLGRVARVVGVDQACAQNHPANRGPLEGHGPLADVGVVQLDFGRRLARAGALTRALLCAKRAAEGTLLAAALRSSAVCREEGHELAVLLGRPLVGVRDRVLRRERALGKIVERIGAALRLHTLSPLLSGRDLLRRAEIHFRPSDCKLGVAIGRIMSTDSSSRAHGRRRLPWLVFIACGASGINQLPPSSRGVRFSAPAISVDIAILGGGPCGLATALALSKATERWPGCTVRVFEKDSLEPKGAAVMLSPLAWAALTYIDEQAAQRIRQVGSPVVSSTSRTLHTHAHAAAAAAADPVPADRSQPPLSRLTAIVRAGLAGLRTSGQPEPEPGKSGTPSRALTTFLWHDVRAALADRVRARLGGGAIYSGFELVGMEEEGEARPPAGLAGEAGEAGSQTGGGVGSEADRRAGKITLRFRTESPGAPSQKSGESDDDGSFVSVRASLVLACDGVRSAAREAAPCGPRAAEVLIDDAKTVWRGLAPSIDVQGVATFFKEDPERPESTQGGRMALLFPAGSGKGASWTVTAPALSGHSRDPAHARARLLEALGADGTGAGVEGDGGKGGARLDGLLARALAASTSVVEHRLVSRNWSQAWPSAVARLAYLGDAAHPLRPTGEGIALALEDAWTLGKLAADAPSSEAFLQPKTLRAYEATRLNRVRAISEATSAGARASYIQPPPTPTPSEAGVRPSQVQVAAGGVGAVGEAPRAQTLAEAVAAHPMPGFGPL
ncbi:hypothetical protein T492DRAFT_1144134 [Pavlovales sp. CCMP2436]|nr:hypothetical protein T492DRAFT_1144134 [Pavlovales sp. CCMP2436]